MKIALADIKGAHLHRYYSEGFLYAEGTKSIIEGIGQARITKNLAGFKPDISYEIPGKNNIKNLYFNFIIII